ncbi:NAD-dependent epimerase/dehydratase family protein [Polyangium sp. y55x31]|uniref:NAD-dependent epimerase/dehydratase family protein n=1 Tax=Polyangium sp. y55x31 TaxID=3042688 RepID=UPI00248246AC|nr:NAD-dependent epimerase/dehydratase family protein [Polyangium sp. y55x31]MDI1482491.1 NAD-dependent epimerase/dehydratase family protein [Polyangium sp. y55x31]
MLDAAEPAWFPRSMLSSGDRARALVLGATGHIGQAMVRELLAHGYHVTAATRRKSPANLEGLDVDLAVGDADAPGQIDAWARGHDVIVDAAAPYPVHRFAPQSSAERDPLGYAVARMRAVLDAAFRSGARLVYIGSFTTLPRNEAGLAGLETSFRRRSHPYFAVKAHMEGMVLDAARHGLPTVLANPTAFLGPWDDKPQELALVPELLSGHVLATVRRIVNVVDVRDAASAIRGALEAEAFGAPLPITGHDVHTDVLAARICELAGQRPPLLRASARLSAAGAFWMEAALSLGGRPSPLPSLALLLVLDAYAMGPPIATTRFGEGVRPLDETLRDAIAWYRSQRRA